MISFVDLTCQTEGASCVKHDATNVPRYQTPQQSKVRLLVQPTVKTNSANDETVMYGELLNSHSQQINKVQNKLGIREHFFFSRLGKFVTMRLFDRDPGETRKKFVLSYQVSKFACPATDPFSGKLSQDERGINWREKCKRTRSFEDFTREICPLFQT